MNNNNLSNVIQNEKNNSFNEITINNSNKPEIINNKIIKPLRKSFLIDSLLEERQKKLAAAAAAIKTNALLLKETSVLLNCCDNNETIKKNENNINDASDIEEKKNSSNERKKLSLFEMIKDKKKLKKQTSDDMLFLLADPSSSSTIPKTTTNALTTNTIKTKKYILKDCQSSLFQCQENNVDPTLDLNIKQNLIKNENDNSSELLNFMTKVLVTSNNNLTISNMQPLSKKQNNLQNEKNLNSNIIENKNNNAMISYLNRLKIVQNTLGFGMSPFRAFNPHFQNYNQLIQMFSEIGNQFSGMPMTSTLPATNALTSVLAKNHNSAMSAAATALFLQQHAATAAAINLKNRFDLSIYTSNLTNGSENLSKNNSQFDQLTINTLEGLCNSINTNNKLSNFNDNRKKTYSETILSQKTFDNNNLNNQISSNISNNINSLKSFEVINRLNGIPHSSQTRNVNNAKTTHRSSNIKKYRCDICDKTFSRSNTLITHKRIHTGEKPFRCENCGRAFRQPGNLTRHAYTHTTVKPFVCTECGKAFNRASNLHTHMRVHNTNNLPSQLNNNRNSRQQFSTAAESLLFS